MRNPIIEVTRDHVIVLDPDGKQHSIDIVLTPAKRILAARTVRALLATGFLIHYDTEWTADEELIRSVLSYIRERSLFAGMAHSNE